MGLGSCNWQNARVYRKWRDLTVRRRKSYQKVDSNALL
jgi:hypothetical protein